MDSGLSSVHSFVLWLVFLIVFQGFSCCSLTDFLFYIFLFICVPTSRGIRTFALGGLPHVYFSDGRTDCDSGPNESAELF